MIRIRLTFIIFLITNLIIAEERIQSQLPVYNISRALGDITIDGLLDDQGWQGTNIINNFLEVMPGENIPPIVRTEAFVTYDSKNFYVAIKCYDDPKNIRAQISKRDRIYNDDYAGFYIDTYGDANRAVEFQVNALGIQGDSQTVGSNEDQSFDMIFTSAGIITEEGYQVEVAVPFSSLRFPDKEEQTWRFSVFRSLPRNDFMRKMASFRMDRNNPCNLCQFGYLKGVSGIKSSRSIEFLPSMVSTQSGELDINNVFQENDFNSDLALGIKIPIGQTTTIEVAINPDFSQIEADVTQFDVNNNFALSYPERRPFFNEGSDLFSAGGHEWQPNIKPVYTRSINDPSVAMKILGRIGKTDYGIITALDDESGVVIPFEFGSIMATPGKSTVNVLRLKHSMDNSSYIGGVITDRRYESGSGTNIGLDGLYYLNQNIFFNWQAFTSYSVEPNDTSLSTDINGETFDSGKYTTDFDGESFKGSQFFLRLTRSTRNNQLNIFVADKTPTFRVDTGYLKQNNERNLGGNYTFIQYPKTNLIEKYFFTIATGRVWNYDMVLKESWFYTSLKGEFKGRLDGDINYFVMNENFLDSIYTDLQHLEYYLDKNFGEKFSIGVRGSSNKSIIRYLETPEIGFTQSYSLWFRFKPTSKININPSLNYNHAKYFDNDNYYYKGQRIRIRFNYQFSQYLSLRLVGQYFYQEDFVNDEIEKVVDLQPLISYQPNPFTIFYIGSSIDFDEGPDGYESFDMFQNSRQIFLKFQYLIQS